MYYFQTVSNSAPALQAQKWLLWQISKVSSQLPGLHCSLVIPLISAILLTCALWVIKDIKEMENTFPRISPLLEDGTENKEKGNQCLFKPYRPPKYSKNVTNSFTSIIYAHKSMLHTHTLSAYCCTEFKSREWGWGHISSWDSQTALPKAHSYEMRLCKAKAEFKPKLHLPKKDKEGVSQHCLQE